jgi:cysteinyl-tRNA synthetase
MDLVIDFRANMKSQKRYDVADSIRDKLKEAGIVIEDTKSGVRWKKGQ